ncbi:hypothetical protein N7513_000250 [Penicillium frequentans]|nr:hypothetical protein N7513_000250 [Penicillium glabrum]
MPSILTMASIYFNGENSGIQIGVYNGQKFYFQERSEPRPEPLSTVPFPRDPDFVGRNEILNQLHEKASIAGSIVALFGLGGVGKTKLAAEYCHQIRQQSANTWVFWVHASNAARCEKSLRDLADRAKIPGRLDRNANIFQVVGNWLEDEKIGKWILVLDNVDDDELFRNPSVIGTTGNIDTQSDSQSDTDTQSDTDPQSDTNPQSDPPMQPPPLRYLFGNSNGTIIITSRHKGVVLKIVKHQNIIEVPPMNPTEALGLIQKKLSTPEEHTRMAQLAQELEFMPLAIIQATAYILQRSSRCSVSEYLLKFQRSDRQAVQMLREEAGLLYRDWEARNSILRTWQISFDYIRSTRPSATDLLSLMSFFDRQGIAQRILRVPLNQHIYKELCLEKLERSSNDRDSNDGSCSSTDAAFDMDVNMLSDFSLISIREDGHTFTMHRLVQLTVRTWLTVNRQLEQWKGRFIYNLYAELPTGQYENWERYRSLFPHVKSAMLHQPESQVSLQQWATVLYRGAWYAQESGHVTESREMASRSRDCRLQLFGEEGEETLDSNAMLAVIYRLEGRWEEAEQLELRAVKIRKTKFGADHLSTLTSMGNLASTYRYQGRWEEAEKLEVQVMATRKAKLVMDHPDILSSMGNLASTYWEQGRCKEAERLEVQVMDTRMAKLGMDHPDTLSSMGNLASTYWEQGRLEEAEKLEVQVMDTSKAKLGPDHPDTLSSMNNLAVTYRKQGRLVEAEQLQVQVVNTRKARLGTDHPDTLSSMHNLAVTYRNQGRWVEAEQLQVQVIDTRKKKLGPDHPDTLSSMNNLAVTYRYQGLWVKTEQLQLQVMDTRKTKLGVGHPDTLKSMVSLASTYRNQGRLEEAEQLEVQVKATRKKSSVRTILPL